MVTRLSLLIALLLLAGCESHTSTPPAPRPVAGPMIEAQAAKDTRVTAAADRIDAATDAPAVRVETAEIRDAVASAPAIDIKPVVDAFNAAMDDKDATINQQRKEIADLKAAVAKSQNKELVYQARGLTLLGFGCLAAFGLGIAFGGGIAAALKLWPVALIGVGSLGLAQVVAHPWFMRGFLALTAAGIAWLAFYIVDRYRAGKLRQSVDKKLEVLRQVVPVLDDAYDEATDTVKSFLDAKIFDRLSSKLNSDQKAAVHAVRAETSATTTTVAAT